VLSCPQSGASKQRDVILTEVALCMGSFRFMTGFRRCPGKSNLEELHLHEGAHCDTYQNNHPQNELNKLISYFLETEIFY